MRLHHMPPPASAEEHNRERQALRALRRLIQARIDRDIAMLDLIDGDTDLEPDACAERWTQPEMRGGALVHAA